jgi:hypothetical protein
MDRRFKILRFIGTVYKILGIIATVGTIIGSVGICLTTFLGGAAMARVQEQLGEAVVAPRFLGGVTGGLIASGFVLLYGAIMALLLYGIGEGIYLLIALEENTRATAAYLQQFSQEPYTEEYAEQT